MLLQQSVNVGGTVTTIEDLGAVLHGPPRSQRPSVDGVIPQRVDEACHQALGIFVIRSQAQGPAVGVIAG